MTLIFAQWFTKGLFESMKERTNQSAFETGAILKNGNIAAFL